MTERIPLLSAYPTELFQLWEAASKAPVTLTMSWNEAHAMRARMYRMRKGLRKTNHPLQGIADAVEIVVEREGKAGNARLVVRPVGWSYISQIRKELPDLPPTSTSTPTPDLSEYESGFNPFLIDKE